MPALVAGIHAFFWSQGVDGRDKSGHDGRRTHGPALLQCKQHGNSEKACRQALFCTAVINFVALQQGLSHTDWAGN
jgi:hypothetical protein